jgi:dynein heavy chain, axonemal
MLNDELNLKIPKNLNIGPFFVDVANLKLQLIEKRNQIIEALKQKLLNNAFKKLSSINSRYEEILNKIKDKPATIEHHEEIVNYIPSIDPQIHKLSLEMKAVSSDFYVIDSFLIIQPDELFSLRWKVLRMPQIIIDRVNELLALREQEIERFRKLQTSDETVFYERLQTVVEEVRVSLKKYSFDDVTVAASVFESTLKLINEMREHGELLNYRWRLLNQYVTVDEDDDFEADLGKEIDLSLLNAEMENLLPFYNFWTITSNFLSSKEMWTAEMPLNELNIEIVDNILKQSIEAIIHSSDEFFINLSDSEKLKNEVDEFKQFLQIVKGTQKSGFKESHWMKLVSKFNLSLTISTIADLKMLGNATEISAAIKSLLIDAEREATREREERIRDEMEKEEMRRREEELFKQKQMRRAKRPDLFN